MRQSMKRRWAGCWGSEPMIGLPSETRVWLASGVTDMRRGFDGLALLVQEVLRRDPHCGHLFVFRGKHGGLIKVLWHDGQGMCLLAKRLERGRFVWPRTEGEAVTISAAQLGYLLEGIDWRLPQRTERPQVAG
jgi:transposase